MLRTAIVFVVALLAAVIGSAQNKLTKPGATDGQVWKEYVYPTDGFAITLPEAPNPHDDAQFPNTTTYTFDEVMLRVTDKRGLLYENAVALGGCDFAFPEGTFEVETIEGRRKLTPSESQFEPSYSSVRKGTLKGYPYLESERTVRSTLVSYERWYCTDKKLYVFSAVWQSAQTKPAKIERIVCSFRLIKQQQ